MRKKVKTVAMYLDGKLHNGDVVAWALAANMTLPQAKDYLRDYYAKQGLTAEFKLR